MLIKILRLLIMHRFQQGQEVMDRIEQEEMLGPSKRLRMRRDLSRKLMTLKMVKSPLNSLSEAFLFTSLPPTNQPSLISRRMETRLRKLFGFSWLCAEIGAMGSRLARKNSKQPFLFRARDKQMSSKMEKLNPQVLLSQISSYSRQRWWRPRRRTSSS